MPKGFEYAGFWLRFAATLIDGLILLIPSLILAFLLPFFEIILNWLYYACLESSKSQATLGKRIVGIKLLIIMEKELHLDVHLEDTFQN